MTTAEGGMVTTDNQVLVDKLLVYRLHGMDRDAWQRYQVRQKDLCDFIAPGYKYNLTDLQASLASINCASWRGSCPPGSDWRPISTLRLSTAFGCDGNSGLHRAQPSCSALVFC